MKTPVMETDRLILRPLTEADAQAAFENWTSDAQVARFMRWERHADIAQTKEWLAAEAALADSEDVYDWGLVEKQSGELIGSAGLVFNEDEGMFELGYNVMKNRWGQGYATEAARCIVEFGIKVLGQAALFCCHARENPASGKVMEKIGFVYRSDGVYRSRDGVKCFAAREYVLRA